MHQAVVLGEKREKLFARAIVRQPSRVAPLGVQERVEEPPAHAHPLRPLVDVEVQDARGLDLDDGRQRVVVLGDEEILRAHLEDAEHRGGAPERARRVRAEEVEALVGGEAVLRRGARARARARRGATKKRGAEGLSVRGDGPEERARGPRRAARVTRGTEDGTAVITEGSSSRTHHGRDGVGEALRARGAHARLVHERLHRAELLARERGDLLARPRGHPGGQARDPARVLHDDRNDESGTRKGDEAPPKEEERRGARGARRAPPGVRPTDRRGARGPARRAPRARTSRDATGPRAPRCAAGDESDAIDERGAR